MGYYYWTMKKSTQRNLAAVTDAAAKIIQAAGIPLSSWGSDGPCAPLLGKPTIEEKLVACGSGEFARKSWIVLNGVGPDGHQTFCWSNKGWHFCKTARKPYDIIVTAILCCAEHLGASKVGSDGGPEDWAEGLALAKRVLDADDPKSIWFGLAVPDLGAGSR